MRRNKDLQRPAATKGATDDCSHDNAKTRTERRLVQPKGDPDGCPRSLPSSPRGAPRGAVPPQCLDGSRASQTRASRVGRGHLRPHKPTEGCERRRGPVAYPKGSPRSRRRVVLWFVQQHEEEPGTVERWDFDADRLQDAYESFDPGDDDDDDEWKQAPGVRRKVRATLTELGRIPSFLAERSQTLSSPAHDLFLDTVEGSTCLPSRCSGGEPRVTSARTNARCGSQNPPTASGSARGRAIAAGAYSRRG